MTTSIWRKTMRLGVQSCEVAIVGAGICGLSAAAEFGRRGLRVVVVDRDSPGSGASGRNAGFLMRGAADNYKAACEQYGRALAGTLWRVSEQNLAMLRAAGVERLPSFSWRPSCLVAFTEEEREQLRESAKLLIEDGFDVGQVGCSMADTPQDSLWQGPLAKERGAMGLVNPGDACCNPVELIGLLRSLCQCPVLEGQEVVSLRRSNGSMEVRLTDGVLRADRVLLSTNAYAGLLVQPLSSIVLPRRGQMLAFRAEGRSLSMNYYANHGSEYFREGYDGTLVFGGCRKRFAETEVGFEDRATPEVQLAIESFARSVIGADRLDVIARWSGVMGFSPDGLPLVGSLGDTEGWDGRVWFCGGFTGHGMSLAHKTATMAVEEMLGGAQTPFPLSRVM